MRQHISMVNFPLGAMKESMPSRVSPMVSGCGNGLAQRMGGALITVVGVWKSYSVAECGRVP